MNSEADIERVRPGATVPLRWAGLEWYVACVERGRDREAREWLEQAGVPVFLLEGSKAYRRGMSGPWLSREWLVLEGYLFIGDMDAARLQIAHWQSDWRRKGVTCPVASFLGSSGKPIAVNGAAMQALFHAHDTNRFSTGKPLDDSVRIGEEVRILKGPFTFIEGIVQKLLGGQMAEIQLELLGARRVAKVRLDSLARLE
jgi:hypothetical protein